VRGLNQHIEFQIKLAGGKTSGGSSGSVNSMPGYVGNVPDDVPDIGSIIPIERV
jgi:hypothetical protein